jgi:hypothetical protein
MMGSNRGTKIVQEERVSKSESLLYTKVVIECILGVLTDDVLPAVRHGLPQSLIRNFEFDRRSSQILNLIQ